MATDQWGAGETCRDLVEDKDWLKELAEPDARDRPGTTSAEKVERDYAVEVSGRQAST